MAIPVDKITFSFKGQRRILLVPVTSWSQSDHFLPGVGNRECLKRVLVKTKVVPKDDSSFIVSELERKTSKGYGERIAVAKEPERKLAEVWREIHGENYWAGMLDPIDPLLQAELIRYGDMAQACYDAFDDDPYSKYYGSSKIRPNMFFESLGHKQCGYEVTSYLFSTYNVKLQNFFGKSLRPDSWSSSANWIGYVAVSNDEYSSYLGRRDITVVWRGTASNIEQIAGLTDFQNPTTYHIVPSRDQTVKVQGEFLNMYTSKNRDCKFCKYSAREQVLAEVKRLKELYAHEELSITITGHSLGSALAILNAHDIAEIGLDVTEDGRVIPVTVFSFSGPRVGNARFKEQLEALGVKVLRIFNIKDKVTQVPGIIFNEKVPKVLLEFGGWSPWCYFHVGKELSLDHESSPFLKETSNLAYIHNLEVLLHLLDGYHGKRSRFWLTGGRDIALVNKTADVLKDHLLIPPNWWQAKNRGLIQDHLGQYVMPERQDYEAYLPPDELQYHLQQLDLAWSET